jgi:hypothetical protein
MTLLTVDQLREHLQSTLSDAALQAYLDSAEAEILRYVGESGDVTELIDGGYQRLSLSRAAGTITTLTETWGTTVYTLDSTDYRIRAQGYVLERLSLGATHPSFRWRGLVSVRYTPVDADAIRTLVQLDLIKLQLDFNAGLVSEKIGDWSQTFQQGATQERFRDEIQSRLTPESNIHIVGSYSGNW